MRIVPAIWTRRACVAAALVCGGLALSGALGIAQDALDVREAQATAPASAFGGRRSPSWIRPEPVLRLDGQDGTARIGAFFNARLGELNLLSTSVEVTRLRPLGDGLQLAEVTVKAKGGSAAVQTLAEWVAVNREAIRATSLTVVPVEGEIAATLTVVMVVA